MEKGKQLIMYTYDPAESVRPRKRVLTPRIQEEKPVTETHKPTNMITYVPQDSGDPIENVFAGIRFKANVPEEVKRSQTVDQLVVEKFDTPDGVRSKSIEKRVPIVEVLRGNPWFEIDGVRPERVQATRARA